MLLARPLRRPEPRRWKVRWLRSLRGSMMKRTRAAAVALCIGLLLAKVVGAAAPAPDSAALPPGGTRRVTRYSGGRVLIEYYPDGVSVCDSWVLVPAETMWNPGVRGALYLAALLYTFLGIAIISDLFMSAIETITAPKEVVRTDRATGETHTAKVVTWNETVSNLTLLALGSSAPEIMMACIETVSTLDGKPGELGPSTIVGSAAFNLLCISAVCIAGVDAPKRIEQFGVFGVTTLSSLLAYVWMVVVTIVWTPCEITVAEGVLTLSFFPLLVTVAYLEDRGCWCRGKRVETPKDDGISDQRRIAEQLREIREEHSLESPTTLTALLQAQDTGAHYSRAVYRINAVRSACRGKAVLPGQKDQAAPTAPDVASSAEGSSHNARGSIEWECARYSVMENAGEVALTVLRKGNASETAAVKYQTEDGSAMAGVKYESRSGHVVFDPGVTEQTISVPIIDDKQFQPDTHFHVTLTGVTGADLSARASRCTVTVIDDDVPGILELDAYNDPTGLQQDEVRAGVLHVTVAENCGTAKLCVARKVGSDGEVSCTVQTRCSTARQGRDYEAVDRKVHFGHEALRHVIEVPIIDNLSYNKSKALYVDVKDAEGGASLGKVTRAKVCITGDPAVQRLVDRAAELAGKSQKVVLDTPSWAQRFKDALTIAAEDGEELTSSDYVMHFLTMFWKLVFSVVPPTGYCNGWLTFLVALFFIGLVTAVVTELAGLFGCVIGLKDPVTAITFVALGTSLPDTFASKTAAENEATADASIGNVTGSNSVNVFLGLGLPWTIASVYKSAKGEEYTYPADDLAFSVVLFLVCACCALGMMIGNRVFHGGELGGPHRHVIAACFVVLWVLYVVVSSLKVYGFIGSSDDGSGGC
eukprot:TRINITY_DN11737_c0_g1_i1.p1 TRINITY_DN11737_c0_g1~~TRINITY_DN11737_c0_g1_i1.p1  ORF type:complete len:873 (+),score=250.18 TRINITY_DN11737_c0_g1_i1:88-2706(+)